jgi:hypothetical protein
MRDLMVDLETMDNKPTSAIVSIGAVFFDKTGLGPQFYKRVSLQSSMDAGLTVSGDTVMWWLKQSDPARLELAKPAEDLRDVLVDFYRFIGLQSSHREVRVWGNGASFDNAILQNAYSATNLTLPWEFWNDRCYRTLKSMHPTVKLQRSGDYHNALDDARSQANHMLEFMGDALWW